MKGIELPINALIIIAVALLVLLGIAAMWMSGWGSGSQGVSVEAAKAAACGVLMRNGPGCSSLATTGITFDGNTQTVPKFDANADGTIDATDTLQALCAKYYGVTTSVPPTAAQMSNCRKVCGCGG